MAGKAFESVRKTSPGAQSSWGDLYYWLRNYDGQQDLLAHDPITVDDATLTVPDSWPATSQDPVTKPEGGPDSGAAPSAGGGFEREPTTRMPIPQQGGHYEASPVNDETWNDFLDHLLDREGYRNTVYRDSLGKPTVGVGHLVRPEDNLQVGDRISDEQVRDLLESDASHAYKAAVEQANELGINDSDFVVALGSVNYQLGTGWRQKFPNTWQHMKDGNYEQAIDNIENSLWAKQTPTRTDDFTQAIEKVAAAEQQDPMQQQPGFSASPSPA